MAILIRDGKYYYWKETGGATIYLGTEATPKIDRIERCIRILESKKEKAEKDLELLKRMARALNKNH